MVTKSLTTLLATTHVFHPLYEKWEQREYFEMF
jgi:hypothetical protein